MKHTIKLISSKPGADINILLTREHIIIGNQRYSLNNTDYMRLLMHCENHIRRSENYHNGVYVYPSGPKWSKPDTYGWSGDEDAWQDANQSFNKTER